MKRLFFLGIILLCPVFVVAQVNIPDNIGNQGGNGSNYSGSGSSGGSAPSTGMSNDPTALTSTQDTPEFQGFQSLGSSTFIGVPNTSTFIGTEQSFDPSTSTSSRRSTPTTSTARRTTTTTRMSTSRTNTMGRTSRSMSDPRSVRSVASSEVAFSPMSVDDRSVAIQTRITRIPNFRSGPDQVAVRMEGNVVTLTGTVATSHERKLAEQLVRLEPGVGTVENRLTVKGE